MSRSGSFDVVEKRHVARIGGSSKLELRATKHAFSYEGIGLSVTDDSARAIRAWRFVLGSDLNTTHLQRKVGIGKFVVMTKALAEVGTRWAETNGWIRRAPFWRYYLSRGEYRTVLKESQADELQIRERGEGRVVPVEEWIGTPRFMERWRAVFRGARSSKPEHLVTGPQEIDRFGNPVVAEAVNLYLTSEYPRRYDGVWWNARLISVEGIAPRGVILPHAIGLWEVTEVQAASSRFTGWRH